MTSLEKKEVEQVETVPKNTYQRKEKKRIELTTFRQGAKGSREIASERPTVLHIHFCSLSNNSKYQLGAQVLKWQQYSIHGHMVDLWKYRANLGKRNFIEWIKVPIFLEIEKTVNPSFLKDNFFSRTDTSISTSIELGINSSSFTVTLFICNFTVYYCNFM